MKHSLKITILFLLTLVLGSTIAFAHPHSENLSEREDIQQFIKEMVKKHKFQSSQLTSWLNQAHVNQTIIDSISKPAESLPWHRYRKIFITNKRIQSGVEFWKNNQETLKKAHQEYGVPEEIIVAILGVETFYGKFSGGYPVLDALVTLAFEYPPRSKFFRKELEQFLLLAREENWDPTTINGSYAGAMGKPQFISSSYRHYAVDFDKTGQRDLINNTEDSIGSIANYFKVHGWQKDQPIAIQANIQGDGYQTLSTSSNAPKPKYSLKQMAKVGVGIQGSLSTNSPLKRQKFALISLEGQSGLEHWLGLENFYVITRYNHSKLYAMAVYELSQEIKSAYNKMEQSS